MIGAIVVTGFLGAGKTTALNALIAARPDRRVAVIENEAGETSVDSDLVHGAARIVEVTGGCACCTLRGELAMALEVLADRAHELDLLIVEASGIADPMPIALAFQAPGLRNAFRLRGSVCLVDAAAVCQADQLPRVWERQLRFADAVLLSKVDLTDEHRLPEVHRRVREHAPDAILIDKLADPALDHLTERLAVEPPAGGPELHGFAAVALRSRGPLDESRLQEWLAETLIGSAGTVLRIKGIVTVGPGAVSTVVQATPTQLELYPVPRRTIAAKDRLVVIGTDLDESKLRSGFERSLCP